jgi:flagellar biogenesis protein FliO
MESLFQLFAVALVFALLGIALWLLKRKDFPGLASFRVRGNNSGRRIEHIESKALTQQHSVHLLKFANRAILVSTQPSGCTLLGSYSWDDVEAAGPKASA